MPVIDAQRSRELLKRFDFKTLFTDQLGWENFHRKSTVSVDGETYSVNSFAEKRGVQIFECGPGANGKIPDNTIRRRIDREVGKTAHERLIIFVDAAKANQHWLWVSKEPGKPTSYRGHDYSVHRDNYLPLLQKLDKIAFSLSDEEALSILGVTIRLKDAFDKERLTKRFYDLFKTEHKAFLDLIRGIPDEEMQRWYASVMISRLMFIYFIQQSRFLDDDINYLRNRLEKTAATGTDRYYSDFLCPLFFEGFALKESDRTAEIRKKLGKIPYLNGGLFTKHQIEEQYGDIAISDSAFRRIFDFFDRYRWHLDERPLADGQEINPDVLGYIFEKYINQKQMGAYYTKEDITEYIGKNTIIPFLLEEARKKCRIAFEGDHSVWRLLSADPDRYIYEPVRRGVIDADGNIIPEESLPEFVRKGMRDPKERMFDRRYNLGEAVIPGPDGGNLALPTETWREYVERRNRCLGLREKLANGEVSSTDDLITLNLDIRQFAQDVVETCEGPELLRAFWHAIVGRIPRKSNEVLESGITILDPTCGSGAFLFAALNILEPLYEACLDRMESFVAELERSGEKHRPEKFGDFRDELERVAGHPNRRYFVMKSIIVNNLFGVDIMEEAVEICKLRLFLKLVAQVEAVEQIEPLPDIDFNIRAGNTLVGFATEEEVRRSVTASGDQFRLLMDDTMEVIERKAADIQQTFDAFRRRQLEGDGSVPAEDKERLKIRLGELEEELNRHLAREYGIIKGKKGYEAAYRQWLKSHQPFHWFIEFYGIMKSGGFDVIIGNPPYLEKSKLGGKYSVLQYQTKNCKDIYAWVVERSFQLVQMNGLTGLIVPVSIASSQSFSSLRSIMTSKPARLWLSHFANRPGQLFVGAQNRLTIFIASTRNGGSRLFSTKYYRWDAKHGERETLFANLSFCATEGVPSFHSLFPKAGTKTTESVITALFGTSTVEKSLTRGSAHPIYWVRVPGYFCQFYLSPPQAFPENGGEPRERGEVNKIYCLDDTSRKLLHCILNSSTFYQFYTVFSDGRHINPSDVTDCWVNLDSIACSTLELCTRSDELVSGMKASTSLWRKSGLLIESVDSRRVKNIIDGIDSVLAKTFGFSDVELDFIINYDIKYRMGRDAGEEDQP